MKINKQNFTETIAKFIFETNFSDLPRDLIHKSKQLILDTIGCAYGGLNTEHKN